MTGAKDPLECLLREYIDNYLAHNRAAHVVAKGLAVLGIGFRPLVDHITFRTLDIDRRAKEFLAWGYQYDAKQGIVEYDSWWAKVYRKPGYPAVFIDQAFDGERGKKSLIPEWVRDFGDKVIHHAAILVDDIESAVFFLEKQGVPFSGTITGEKNTDLRQTFSVPEMIDGKAFSVLKLAERHRGYEGFLPPQADGRMESSRR
ncbi:MAG: hypothetical protein A2Z83_08680 [Omnitrophica bacterium GWA2_52_8]|nr:MAG: hypothetical protein A2Z83_08680 [Omnitrophica bacterium GWA2_52_8]